MPKKKKSASKKTKIKKISTKKRKATYKKSTNSPRNINVEKALIDNFIALQKVMTNISIKFDSLSNQISKLLNLFEISAKSLAEKDFGLEKSNKESKQIIEKLDNLMSQNKTIARGLTLMHETNNPSRQTFIPEQVQEPPTHGQINPLHPIQKSTQPQNLEQGLQGYQRS
ncbi:MAG: hypothetical protein ACE5EJ_02645, partial [Nitrosopumilaceae archaeon]